MTCIIATRTTQIWEKSITVQEMLLLIIFESCTAHFLFNCPLLLSSREVILVQWSNRTLQNIRQNDKTLLKGENEKKRNKFQPWLIMQLFQFLYFIWFINAIVCVREDSPTSNWDFLHNSGYPSISNRSRLGRQWMSLGRDITLGQPVVHNVFKWFILDSHCGSSTRFMQLEIDNFCNVFADTRSQ
jgi:hypothetical protein